jgi:ABC-type antimicrobial peptide transport system permease subunit
VIAAGVAIGSAAAMGLAPALRTFLVGISPFDPVAFGIATMFLAIVGLAAGFLPAHRTSQVEPIRALKSQ